MAMDGSVEFEWGSGMHKFRIGIDEARELQTKTGFGLERLMLRILSRDYAVDDLRETIRIGMIGGGASPGAAMNEIRIYFDKQPKALQKAAALEILNAYNFGVKDEPVGTVGNGSGKEEAKETNVASSLSPVSTH